MTIVWWVLNTKKCQLSLQNAWLHTCHSFCICTLQSNNDCSGTKQFIASKLTDIEAKDLTFMIGLPFTDFENIGQLMRKRWFSYWRFWKLWVTQFMKFAVVTKFHVRVYWRQSIILRVKKFSGLTQNTCIFIADNFRWSGHSFTCSINSQKYGTNFITHLVIDHEWDFGTGKRYDAGRGRAWGAGNARLGNSVKGN